jgi:hypothetical protein
MPQLFPEGSNTLAKVSIVGAALLGLGAVVATYWIQESPYVTRQNVVLAQPVEFSHKHHVQELGLDCRYCHTSAETSASAGMPPTYTCMTCHSQIWAQSPMLEPVRVSLAKDEPIHWNRVHDMPDFVYFNHSIHVQKGVGCASCHGPVDQMPLAWKAEPMTMKWCLDCHRHPEKHLRPQEEIFNMTWKPESQGKDQLTLGRELIKAHNIPVDRLTNCSTCHR